MQNPSDFQIWFAIILQALVMNSRISLQKYIEDQHFLIVLWYM